jgi:hypothetical protein
MPMLDVDKAPDGTDRCVVLFLPKLTLAQDGTAADKHDHRYWITLSAVGMTSPIGEQTTSDELDIPVFLDSGSTLCYLPDYLYQAIGQSYPSASFDSDSGFFFVDCDPQNAQGSVDFIFKDTVISVPYADFIWKADDTDNTCVLGMQGLDSSKPGKLATAPPSRARLSRPPAHADRELTENTRLGLYPRRLLPARRLRRLRPGQPQPASRAGGLVRRRQQRQHHRHRVRV